MSIELAQSELFTTLGEVFNLPLMTENTDIKLESTCKLYVLVKRVKTSTVDELNYTYWFNGVVMLTLGAPCMKPIGYLLDRRNYGINQGIMRGLGLAHYEIRMNNRISMEFEFFSKSYEYNSNPYEINKVADPELIIKVE